MTRHEPVFASNFRWPAPLNKIILNMSEVYT